MATLKQKFWAMMLNNYYNIEFLKKKKYLNLKHYWMQLQKLNTLINYLLSQAVTDLKDPL